MLDGLVSLECHPVYSNSSLLHQLPRVCKNKKYARKTQRSRRGWQIGCTAFIRHLIVFYVVARSVDKLSISITDLSSTTLTVRPLTRSNNAMMVKISIYMICYIPIYRRDRLMKNKICTLGSRYVFRIRNLLYYVTSCNIFFAFCTRILLSAHISY